MDITSQVMASFLIGSKYNTKLQTIYLGAHNTMEDALQARNNAEEKLFGEYSIKRSVIKNDANG